MSYYEDDLDDLLYWGLDDWGTLTGHENFREKRRDCVRRGLWLTKTLEEIPVTKMDDTHLRNALRFIHRMMCDHRMMHEAGSFSDTSRPMTPTEALRGLPSWTLDGSIAMLLDEWSRRGYHENAWWRDVVITPRFSKRG